ncbi:MAG: DUF3365 domain-containing protein [Peptococcaceae bacterium]|nr:DUF3365 domain-containing protein [Peptococcaceae bacterium]
MFKGIRLRLLVNIVIIIVAMAILNLVINVYQYREQADKQMEEKAAVVAQQLIAMRKFISMEQDTINTDTQTGNFEFKHLNPATVGRQVGYIFEDLSGYTYKQTRLRPRVTENSPDQYEIKAMLLMDTEEDKRITDYFSREIVEGEALYRYVVPLYFEESCLKCHGMPQGETDVSGYPKEGGKLGEFAGAISITFPAKAIDRDVLTNTVIQGAFLLLILLVTFLVLYLSLGRIVVKPLRELTTHVDRLGSTSWEDNLTTPQGSFDEMKHLSQAFNSMSERLQGSYSNLEDRVEERTVMLREANEELRVKGEEMQRINSLLSDSDRMKSELMAKISSGLRQPLTSIIAFSQMVLANPSSQQDQSQYLMDILWNAQNLDAQINDLMTMSKIEAGLMGLEYMEFRFEDILKELRATMNPIFSRKNLRFNVDIATTTPSVVADFEKMRHVFRNLLANALKYTPEGGWVRVRIEPMPVGVDGREFILIQISDSGLGIKSEDLPNIFSSMWQSKSGQDGKGGMGLAIVKIFVELHGGTVDVKSIWQKGSLFTLKIPRSPED